MSRLTDYLEKLKAATEDEQTQMLLRIIGRHKAQLIDTNQAQLFEGRNARDEALGEYRNAQYAAFKNRLNPKPGLGNWDLRLTGALYDSMDADISNFPIVIDASDPKADRFRDASPFGLNDKGKIIFREEVSQDIKEYYASVFSL